MLVRRTVPAGDRRRVCTDVSADGKALVIKGTGPGPDGKPVAFSTLYDRQ